MKKELDKLNRFMNLVICTGIGILIGHSLSVWGDYRRYPELYAMQSSPWYSSILTYGVFTAVVVAAALVVKAVIARRKPKS